MSDFILHLFACIGIAAVVLICISLVMIAIMLRNAVHDPDDVWRYEDDIPNASNTLESLDCVDRQAVIDIILDKCKKSTTLAIRMKLAVESLPSAQPEQRTGKWVRKRDGVFCSNCYLGWDFITGVPSDIESRYRYCPNCGADMRGKQNV